MTFTHYAPPLYLGPSPSPLPPNHLPSLQLPPVGCSSRREAKLELQYPIRMLMSCLLSQSQAKIPEEAESEEKSKAAGEDNNN